jgi:Zn-dependent protease with chaperone function
MSAESFLISSCEQCTQHIEFPAEGVGMRVVCPHCGRETTLLVPTPPASENLEEITAAELKSALEGVVARSRISIFYQAGLVLVALLMILLPCAYAAFACLAAWATYWYARHALVIFSGFNTGFYVMLFKAIAYIGPLVGGIVAVFFMFKPILARAPKRAEPTELNPAQHPRLYQFIAHISDLLRVSMPKRIYLDCELNASAGFRRGFLSFFGNDLVLTLGLPMVGGLNTRQLASIVAHELGHCTQAFAMRLGYVINRIDGWFVRVIYQRDTWDEALDEWSNSVDDWRLSLVVACAHLGVWFSRRVLLLLMMVGHAASCFLSRQMEYHADACSLAVVGSEGVESSLIRTRELSVLEHLGYGALQQIWQKRHQLPDSVPDFLAQLERQAPAGFHEQARQTLLNESAGFFATHPTDCQRIQKARRRAEPGLFAIEKPARALFNDFAATAQFITARHYRRTLRLAVTDPMLKPVAQFFQEPAEGGARTRFITRH